MKLELRLISSMATRALLAELADAWSARQPGVALHIESVGGVDAAKRVQAGEALDAVVLAGNAIDKLMAEGHVRAGSRVDLVRSGMAVAVRAGAPAPDIGSEPALRHAVQAAASVGFSTGPSGVHLQRVFESWGLDGSANPRFVQAPPGVPVGRLVADGEVEIGFQQYSELMSLTGITVLGAPPPGVQVVTLFAGAVASTSAHAEAVQAVQTLLAWMASAETDVIKTRHGMEHAR